LTNAGSAIAVLPVEVFSIELMGIPSIFFLSGASGVGKTSIVEKLKAHYHSSYDYAFVHFDSIGVPSPAEMIEQAGSVEKWQELTTYRWIENITVDYQDKKLVLIEGQVNLDFIESACHKFGIARYFIVLIDCDWERMCERLVYNRQQPELVNQDMKNWATFLRKQAQHKNLPIVDTSHQTLEQAVKSVNLYVLAGDSLDF
jgi:shikimate kinase